MKRKIGLIALVILLIGSMNTYGQFRDRAFENRIKNKIRNKAHQKGKKEAEKGIKKAIKEKYSGKDIAAPEQNYTFTYQYDMKVTTHKKENTIHYYINPKSDYTGFQIKQKDTDIFMVIDTDRKALYSFMDMNNNPIYTKSDLNKGNETPSKVQEGNYTITDLPNKTFLNYSCKGKQIEDKKWKTIIYYTKKAGINQDNLYKATAYSKAKNNPINYPQLKELKNSLVMYVKKINKRKPKNFSTMECTKLIKKAYTFQTDKYSDMGF